MHTHRSAWLGALLLAATLGTAEADPMSAARSEFMAAYQQVGRTAAGPDTPADDSDRLRDYPLYPYLQAARLLARLDDPAAAADIEGFLATHGAAPVARPLRRGWLMSLARREAWEPYLAAYLEEVDDSTAARCNTLAARVALGRTEGLAEAIAETYLSPRSLPPACDPAFDWLREQGQLTADLIERRARLALPAGEAGLARYLARSLPAERAAPRLRAAISWFMS
jgi:soluble lytic murein transglycosylase